MGSVAKQFDRTWNLVTFNRDSDGSMESQLFVEVADQANFDDVLSNTSSDESDWPTKPNTADSSGGNDNSEDIMVVSMDDTEDTFLDNSGEEVEDEESTVRKIYNALLEKLQGLSTLQVMFLTSSTTVLVYFLVEQLWMYYGLRNSEFGRTVASLMPMVVPGEPQENTVMFNNVEISVPFERFGTRKFIVDFEKKVAYPISSADDFIPTQLGKQFLSKLMAYQLLFLYRLQYECLPRLAYKYQIFRNHVNDGVVSLGTLLSRSVSAAMEPISINCGCARDFILDFYYSNIYTTWGTLSESYEALVSALSSVSETIYEKLTPTGRVLSQAVGYYHLPDHDMSTWSLLDGWISKKWILVSSQACRYLDKIKLTFSKQ
ncbi:HHL158Cp [Eremothecium sinecaudum]|uniref:HHL158Cp n=1 Tax=Eremothecium sinecaudum TaxID=45286 RepID=A0A0X8HW51_9SACH|nr:HHL158Cp [Eremothecium sinecaudum]AMD22612.1 HHL158Cp [Eremothecium sinecaudum]